MIKTTLTALCLGLLAACSRGPAAFPDANFTDVIEIAPLDEALTFARTQGEKGTELWAIREVKGNQLGGINLTRAMGASVTDPITLFGERGYEELAKVIAGSFEEPVVSISGDDLTLPVGFTDLHIAAGTNFAAHAEESEVEDGPFLFTKAVTPTPFRAPVSAGDALLDFEVELAFVTLEDAPLPDAPQSMGLILSNDFTNRATLMRNLNPDDVTSGEGFTTGKSAPGYLPVGSLFVIPRDLDAFVANTHLKLAVNGQLRQQAPMSLAIWDIDEIFRQTELRTDVLWNYKGEKIGLPLRDGVIPARTLILAGTPDGTIFQGVSGSDMAFGVLRWIAFGWNQSLPDRVIDRVIKRSRRQGQYLKPGDEVVIQVDRMGSIETPIVE